MRPRLGLDLDGVVYDWHSAVIFMLRTYRGLDLPDADEVFNGWDALDRFTTAADREWLWTTGVEMGLFRYAHLCKGAIEGVRQLARWADIAVLTARPVSAMQDTIDFLSYSKLPISEFYLMGEGRPKSQAPRCDVYIDDAAHNAVDIYENVAGYPKVLLWDRPWNQDFQEADYTGIYRVSSWDETLQYVIGERKAA